MKRTKGTERLKNKSQNYVNRFHIERNLGDEDLSLKVLFFMLIKNVLKKNNIKTLQEKYVDTLASISELRHTLPHHLSYTCINKSQSCKQIFHPFRSSSGLTQKSNS